jgi:hypothetical protein
MGSIIALTANPSRIERDLTLAESMPRAFLTANIFRVGATMVKAQERTSGLPAANGPARASSDTLGPA